MGLVPNSVQEVPRARPKNMISGIVPDKQPVLFTADEEDETEMEPESSLE